MKCHECQKNLSAYYDHMLDEKEERAITMHLKACKSCQEEYKQLVEILNCLNEAKEEITVPPLVHKKMLEKVAKEANCHRIRPIRLQHVAGMVAVLLVGIIWTKSSYFNVVELSTDESVAENTVMTKGRMVQEVEETLEVATMLPIEESIDSSESNPIDEMKVWQIEVDEVEAFTEYLEAYSKKAQMTVEKLQETPISFRLSNIQDSAGLFEDLQKQAFTKELIILIKEGKEVKIIVKA